MKQIDHNVTYKLKLPGGIGFVLFVVFLVLKLTEHIDWSWWWVTAPLWAIPALLVAIIAACFAIVAVAAVGAFAASVLGLTQKP